MKQADNRLSQMVSRLQIFRGEGDKLFITHKLRERLSLLNFLRTTVLGFMMSKFSPVVSHKRTSC